MRITCISKVVKLISSLLFMICLSTLLYAVFSGLHITPHVWFEYPLFLMYVGIPALWGCCLFGNICLKDLQ